MQREPISCVSISAPAAGSGPGFGQGARRRSWSAVGLLGTGSTDGVAMVWDTGHTAGDLGEHNLLTVMAHDGKPVNDITFVAGNHLAVTASSDEAVRVWRMADGTLLQSLVTGEANVKVLAAVPRGRLSGQWTIQLLLALKLACVLLAFRTRADPGAGRIRDVTDSTNSNQHQEDTETKTKSCSHKLVALSDHSAHSITSLSLLDEGRLMAVSENGTVRIFRLDMQTAADTAHFEVESSDQPLGKSCVIAVWEGVINPSITAVPSAPSEPATALTLPTSKEKQLMSLASGTTMLSVYPRVEN